jgi:hypothetical protein
MMARPVTLLPFSPSRSGRIVKHVPLPDGFEVPSASKKMKRMPDGSLIIDAYRSANGTMIATLYTPGDHPNLKRLPSDAPEVVKQLYLPAFQIRLLRAREYPIAEVLAAAEAWDRYAGLKVQHAV